MRVLNESVDENHRYHYTNINGLIGILETDKLYGNPETKGFLKGIYTVSFSRKGAGRSVDPQMITSPFSVKMIFDFDKLRADTKYVSFNYVDNLKSVRNKKLKARQIESERGKGNSEYEDAFVLGETKKSFKIESSISGVIGIVYIDSGLNILKVTSESGSEVRHYTYVDNPLTHYQLDDGFIYTIEVHREIDNFSGNIMGWYLEVKLDWDDSYYEATKELDEEDEYYEDDLEEIDRELSEADPEYSIPIEFSSDSKFIRNISKKLKGIQLSKRLYDILFNGKKDFYLERDLKDVLYNQRTTGLNADDTRQRTVNHQIYNLQELKEFLDDKLIKKGKSVGFYNYTDNQ